MCQIQNGPTVKIVLDNGMLKGAQMPNDQFFVNLVPTSSFEFYVKEINGAIGFERNPATNDYSLVVFQNGQKYPSKRVSK